MIEIISKEQANLDDQMFRVANSKYRRVKMSPAIAPASLSGRSHPAVPPQDWVLSTMAQVPRFFTIYRKNFHLRFLPHSRCVGRLLYLATCGGKTGEAKSPALPRLIRCENFLKLYGGLGETTANVYA